MLRYLIRRLLLTIPVLLGVATLVFALIHLVPGDPAQAMLGEGASPEDVAELRHSLGLDRPLLTQYGAFLGGRRCTAISARRFGTNEPVTAQIRDGCPAHGELALAAMLVAIVFAIPLGIVAAVFRGTRVDHAAMTLALAGDLDAEFLARTAARDPVRRRARVAAGLGHAARLRTWCCRRSRSARALAAILARMTRASVLEELRELYVLAARARGAVARRAPSSATRSATA